MIKVIIYSDCSLYKETIRKIAADVFSTKDTFQIQDWRDFQPLSKDPETLIFIVDLENYDGIEKCYQIRENYPEAILLLLTSYSKEMQSLKSAYLEFACYSISKEKMAEELTDVLISCLSHSEKPVCLSIATDQIQFTIPLEEITSFYYANQKIILHGKNKQGKSYTYTITSPKKDFLFPNQLYTMQEKEIKIYLKNIQGIFVDEKKKSVKEYSKVLKEECNRLRKAGISVQTIRKLKNVSASSIYRWEKEEAVKKQLKDFEIQLSKYKKIEKIIKDE